VSNLLRRSSASDETLSDACAPDNYCTMVRDLMFYNTLSLLLCNVPACSLLTAWEGTELALDSTFETVETAQVSSADALFAKDCVPHSNTAATTASQRALTPKLLLESLAAHKHKPSSRPATAHPCSQKHSISSKNGSAIRKHTAVCKLPAVSTVRHASTWDDSPLFGARCPVAHPELLAQQQQQQLQQQQRRQRSLSPENARIRPHTAACVSSTVHPSVCDRRCTSQADATRSVQSPSTDLQLQHSALQPSNSMVTSSSAGRLHSAPMQQQQLQQRSARAASKQQSVRSDATYNAVAACYSAAVESSRKAAVVKALLRKALPWQAQLCPRALQDFELARTAVFYRQQVEAAAVFTHARLSSVKALLHGEDAWCADVSAADWTAVDMYRTGLQSTADTVKEHVSTALATRLTVEVSVL
jgi:hypothetical protein